MRTCSQQAAAFYNRTNTAIALPVAAPSQLNSQHVIVRLPRSPPTSPRHQLDPSDPQLVQHLRAFLSRAAQRPPGVTEELEELLVCKLQVSPNALQELFSNKVLSASSSSSVVDAGSGFNSSTGIRGSSTSTSSNITSRQQQLQELELGLDHLLQLFSPAEVFHLLQQQPALLFAPLASWCEFFEAYGFTASQVKNLISQTHGEVMTKGTLVTAGEAIVHLRSLGFDNDEVRHRVVAYCPQILAMNTEDISMLIKLWEKFRVGVDERAGM